VLQSQGPSCVLASQDITTIFICQIVWKPERATTYQSWLLTSKLAGILIKIGLLLLNSLTTVFGGTNRHSSIVPIDLMEQLGSHIKTSHDLYQLPFYSVWCVFNMSSIVCLILIVSYGYSYGRQTFCLIAT